MYVCVVEGVDYTEISRHIYVYNMAFQFYVITISILAQKIYTAWKFNQTYLRNIDIPDSDEVFFHVTGVYRKIFVRIIFAPSAFGLI